MILPAAGIAKGLSFFDKPISAGPYKVQQVVGAGEEVILVRNDNYFGAKPVVPKFHYIDVVDPNTRVVQLKSGQLDFAGSLPPSLIPQLTDSVSAAVVPQHGAFFLWVSIRQQPMSDVRVRKAINYAIDRKQLNQIIWFGKSKPLGGLFPSTFKEHVANIPIDRDVAKAKELLVGTACATGCSLHMQVRNGRPIDEQAATIIQQNLKDIGINVMIEGVDNSIATKHELDGTFGMEAESLDLPLDVPDSWLTFAVISNGGIEALFSGYKSADMDAAANKAIASQGAERDAAIAQVNAIFARDLPYFPLLDDAIVVGTRPATSQLAHLTAAGEFEVERQK
jgi:ABC-type transport system substrate-binding protein